MTRKDISSIFKDATDEQITALLDINSTDIGKAKGDTAQMENELATAKSTIADYESTIGELKASAGDAEKLTARIADLEKAISDREAADKAAAEEAALLARFNTVSDGKQFINDFTKNGIVAEFKDALAKDENKGKGDAEIFAAMVKDRDGIFVNPNAPQDIPGTGNIPPAGTLDDNQVRAVMGLPPKN